MNKKKERNANKKINTIYSLKKQLSLNPNLDKNISREIKFK